MDDSMLAFLVFIAVFVVLDVAALRYGVDSRRLTRELPLAGDAAIRMTPDVERRARTSLTFEATEESRRVNPELARAQALSESPPHPAGVVWGTAGGGGTTWRPGVGLKDGLV